MNFFPVSDRVSPEQIPSDQNLLTFSPDRSPLLVRAPVWRDTSLSTTVSRTRQRLDELDCRFDCRFDPLQTRLRQLVDQVLLGAAADEPFDPRWADANVVRRREVAQEKAPSGEAQSEVRECGRTRARPLSAWAPIKADGTSWPPPGSPQPFSPCRG